MASSTAAWPWRGGLWQNAAFCRFWLAQAWGQLGGHWTQFVLPSVAILELRASPLEVGLIAACENAPYLAVGLFAGVVADRLSRRDVMIVAGFGRALVFASVALAAAGGNLSIAHVVIASGTAGFFTMFFAISNQAYVPEVVDRGDLVEANAKLQATQAIAELLGPVLAGIAIQAAGATPAVLLTVALHAAAPVVLLGAPSRKARPGPWASPGAIRQEIGQGLGLIWSDRGLRGLALTSATLNFGHLMFTAVLLVYAYRGLGLAPQEVGSAIGLGSIGLLFGVTAAAPLASRLGVGWTLIVACSSIGAGILLTPLAHVTAPLLVLAGTRALIAAHWPLYIITDNSFRQATVPLSLQGRLNASLRVLVLGIGPLCSLFAGLVASAFGTTAALFVAGSIVLLSGTWVLQSPLRRRGWL